MKTERELKEYIVKHLILAIISILFFIYWCFETNILNTNNWYSSLIIFLAFVVVLFFINKCFEFFILKFCDGINYNILLFMEKNKSDLVLFQKYLIKKHQDEVRKHLFLITGKDYKGIELTYSLKKQVINDIKNNKEKQNKKDAIENVKNYFKDIDLPYYYFLFESYYNGELIKKEKISISSVISTLFGFITTITLNIVYNVDIILWLVMGLAFILFIVFNLFSLKKEQIERYSYYKECLQNMQEEYKKFKNKPTKKQ